jgi:hypothetical protein
MVKVKPHRSGWRQERGENCIQQLMDLQKEPSPDYPMSEMTRVVKCHEVAGGPTAYRKQTWSYGIYIA